MSENILLNKLSNGVLLSDGSMGALLGAMGYGTPCPDYLAIEKPEVIKSIHEQYLNAGADILISDTFGATEPVLSHKGHSGMSAEITGAAVSIAKEVAGDKALVACDMGPTGEFIYPVGERSFDEVYGWFYEQAVAAKGAGADFAFLETHTDLAECRAACLAAKDAGLSVIASCSVNEKARLLTGASVKAFAVTLAAAGADALGINCSLGPEQMLLSLKQIMEVTSLPVAVQPNAGLPITNADGSVTYPFDAKRFFEGMKLIAEGGASVIGGCCGTTPEHIKRLSALKGEVRREKTKPEEYLSSAREAFEVSEALSCIEDISDPEDAYDADEDTTALGINDEDFDAEKLLELASMTKLPVVLSVSDPQKAEEMLRVYPGRMAVKGADEAANKYGAYIIK